MPLSMPADDALPEHPETVMLTLQLPPVANTTGYLIGTPHRGTAVILDNDHPRPPCMQLPDGQFHICHPGTNGLPFRIEASPDLKNWIPLCTNVVVDGAIHFVDPDAAAFRNRFFRASPEANPPAE